MRVVFTSIGKYSTEHELLASAIGRIPRFSKCRSTRIRVDNNSSKETCYSPKQCNSYMTLTVVLYRILVEILARRMEKRLRYTNLHRNNEHELMRTLRLDT